MTAEEMIKQRRNEKLISLGYYRKVFCADRISDGNTTMYPYKGTYVDPIDGISKTGYYKKVALEVTDEEFAQIIAIGSASIDNEEGTLPKVFKWLGIVEICIGIIVGMIGAAEMYRGGFIYFLTCTAVGAIIGLTSMWMGEVLKALRTKK